MLWTEKYRPKQLSDVVGNEEQIAEVKKWAHEFERNKVQKPILLHGPPGVGKTASARALANEFKWTLIETNASDLRDPANLKKLLGVQGRGLFNDRRVFLLDEIDGAFDRGEVPELMNVLKNATQPIILTANDIWDKHLANVRPLCKAIELKKVNYRTIANLLTCISQSEKMEIDKIQIEAIAKGSNGDVRSAITDLQSGGISSRDRETNVFEAVRIVFKTMEYKKSNAASDNLDIDLDTFVKWIEENIPIEYEKLAERSVAFEWIAKSDIMKRRIWRREYWGLLRYIKAYSHAGVSLSKIEMYRKFSPYQFPSLLRTLSASKVKRAARESLCKKLGSEMHCSAKKVTENLPLIATALLKQGTDFTEDEVKILESFSVVGNEFKPNKKQQRKHK